MTQQKKIALILQMFSEGKASQEIAEAAGYSGSRSLSRFMLTSGYRWNKVLKNYITDLNFEQQEPADTQQEVTPTEIAPEMTVDLAIEDLMNSESVRQLLMNANEIISLLEGTNTKAKCQNQNFWKDAQQFGNSKERSITKCFRFSISLDDQLTKLSTETGLTQKQIVCLALDSFLKQFAPQHSTSMS
ncbi:hypothetical protein [Brevibacillus choshinensis]|uniref:hypothetical protein n=1 Tax=Brevibacillus choshinensis TaxID=54911 RepID=UPI002E241134|nr:hypothetical protein [Brevibacillus choshinensis]